jgi:hypothetical protein
VVVRRQRGEHPVSERRSDLLGLVCAVVATATIVLGASPDVVAAPSPELQRYPYLTDLVGGSVSVNFATVATGTDAASVQWGPVGSCTANTVAATRVAPITVNGASRWRLERSVRNRGWPLAGKSVAMFNALGNHGRTLSSGRSAYLENWPSSTAASTSGGRYQIDAYPSMNGTNATSYPSAWYAFDAGQIRFYILDATWSNSNPGTLSMPDALYKNDYDQHWQPSRAEYQWLQSDLEANRGKAKIAVFHFPMYSANGSGGSASLAGRSIAQR